MRFKVSIAYLLCLPFLAGALLIAAALRADARTIEIVGVGDSLMAGYQLPQPDSFPSQLQAALRAKGYDVEIGNAGVSGDTTSDGLARLAWSVPEGTGGVLLELGGNDALRGISPAQTRANLARMIEQLQARKIQVLLVGMLAPPNMGEDYARRFNSIFPEMAKKYDLVFYPFFLDGVATHADLQLPDGIHPNGKGAAVMAKRFLPYAERLIDRIRAAAQN